MKPRIMDANKPADYEPYWCFVFRDKEEKVEIIDEENDEKVRYEFDCWRFNFMYVNAAGEVLERRNGTVLFGGGLYPITEYNK
jgi:hypothetical protein